MFNFFTNKFVTIFLSWQFVILWYILSMYKKDYDNSVVLLGPKGVGKSLIAGTPFSSLKR